MTLAALERRLAKIETARRPPKGLFYVAWGRTPEEIETALALARAAGTIADGDPVVRCAWPIEYPMPASRWALDDFHEFDKPEFGALMGEVDRLQDAWIVELRAELGERGVDMPTIPDDPPPAERHPGTRGAHDAALFAVILAVPLNGERASLTEDRLARIVGFMCEVGLRDRIRGRDAAILDATERAGRLMRH